MESEAAYQLEKVCEPSVMPTLCVIDVTLPFRLISDRVAKSEVND